MGNIQISSCKCCKYNTRNDDILRSTEGAVRGHQYSPRPSIQPVKRSFEGCIDGSGAVLMAEDGH